MESSETVPPFTSAEALPIESSALFLPLTQVTVSVSSFHVTDMPSLSHISLSGIKIFPSLSAGACSSSCFTPLITKPISSAAFFFGQPQDAPNTEAPCAACAMTDAKITAEISLINFVFIFTSLYSARHISQR